MYKRQLDGLALATDLGLAPTVEIGDGFTRQVRHPVSYTACLLYTSDAADERSSVDLGGRRIIKKKKEKTIRCSSTKT